MASFLGMRDNASWQDGDMRPKNWRQMLLRLYPNGRAPLTAIMSMGKKEKTDDPQYYWWVKALADQTGTPTGKYTSTNLSSAYASGGVAGDNIFIKMSAADAGKFRERHAVLMRYSSDPSTDVVGRVTADPVINGASSYITVQLLEADDNSGSYDLSDCNMVMVIGDINEEGAGMPPGIAYDPTKYYNYTQIFRTPLRITRTAKKTRLRTPEAYQEMKREALELHGIGMERAFLYGVRSEGTGDEGHPERTTSGLLWFYRTYASGNVDSFDLNSTYSGKTWVQQGGGKKWLDTYLEQMFRYGSGEKLALCGSQAIMGIQELAETYADVNIVPGAKSFGLKVMKWITPFGDVNLMTHPLFTYNSATRRDMVILEPRLLRFRYIDETMFKKDDSVKKGGDIGRDAIQEEYLTEAGLEVHYPEAGGYLTGVGSDSAV